MTEQINVLAGFIMDGNAGGIDKYLLHLLDKTDRDKTRIDFLTNKISPELKEKLGKYGSELYEVATLKHPVKQYKQVCKILNSKHYDATYFNISTAINIIGPYAAKKCNIKRRIIHSHSTAVDSNSSIIRFILNTAHKICKKKLYKYANRFYACSRGSGMWLFPEKIVNSDKFKVINNAIDVDKFKYNAETRERVRKKLGIQNKFVIGNVGNFCYQKNHEFLIRVFQKALKKYPESYLLLVGDGIDFNKIKKMVHDAGIEDNVLFTGRRNDVNELFQAMDVFVLPSRFEGLCLVGIEAQTAGLKCIFSDKVTEDIQITDNCRFLELSDSDDKWENEILSYRVYERKDMRDIISEHGYSLSGQINEVNSLFV